MGLFDKLGCDVALYVGGEFIHLGTGHSDWVRIPAYVAIHAETRRVLAVGDEAQKMWGKAPTNISVLKVFKLGIPADFDLVEALFRYCLKKYIPTKLIPPR